MVLNRARTPSERHYDDHDDDRRGDPAWRGDAWNIALLLVLYTLQGLPMGISVYVRMELKQLFVGSFAEVATFALASWPFSLKVFWAPIVDAWYIERWGRRKTWLVPAQLLIAGFLLYLSNSVSQLLATKSTVTLTALFFTLYTLCATQDIALDGWAVTMLRQENAGYASVCNAAGQGIGFFIGMMGPTFHFITFSGFLSGVACVFLSTTLIVATLYPERATPDSEQVVGIEQSYRLMLRVCRLPAVQQLCVYLLTCKIAFVPLEDMVLGKLQDSGLSIATAATIRSVTTPLEFVVPWLLTAVPALSKTFLKSPLTIVGFITLRGYFSRHVGGSLSSPPARLLSTTVPGRSPRCLSASPSCKALQMRCCLGRTSLSLRLSVTLGSEART